VLLSDKILKDIKILEAEFLGYILTGNTINNNNVLEFVTENEFNIERFYKILFNLEIDYEPSIRGKVFVAKIKNTKKVESKKNIQQTQENFSGRTALITICTIVVVFVSFYFLTDYLVSKRTVNKENTNSNTNLNTKNITFQDLLKKSEKITVS